MKHGRYKYIYLSDIFIKILPTSILIFLSIRVTMVKIYYMTE